MKIHFWWSGSAVFGLSTGLEEKLLTDFCSWGHNLSAAANSGLSVGAPQTGCRNIEGSERSGERNEG